MSTTCKSCKREYKVPKERAKKAGEAIQIEKFTMGVDFCCKSPNNGKEYRNSIRKEWALRTKTPLNTRWLSK